MSRGSSRRKLNPPPLGLELQRGAPEVGEGPVYPLDAQPVEHVVEAAVVGVHEVHAILPGGEAAAGEREHVGVAIEPEDAGRPRLEQGRRVPAGPHRAVDDEAPARRIEELDRLGPQDRLV